MVVTVQGRVGLVLGCFELVCKDFLETCAVCSVDIPVGAFAAIVSCRC